MDSEPLASIYIYIYCMFHISVYVHDLFIHVCAKYAQSNLTACRLQVRKLARLSGYFSVAILAQSTLAAKKAGVGLSVAILAQACAGPPTTAGKSPAKGTLRSHLGRSFGTYTSSICQ